MSPEEALKHIGSLVDGIDKHTKPAMLLPTIQSVQELVRKVRAEEAEARKRVRAMVKEATAKQG